LQGFKSGRIPVIVATDVLSRGIDIDTIDVVVNYDVPHDGEDYIHRIGRTARAEKEGKAFTLVSDKEIGRFSRIESLIGKVVDKAPVPSELGPAPEYIVHRRSGGSRSGGAPPQRQKSQPRQEGRQRQEGQHKHESHHRQQSQPKPTPQPRSGPPLTIEKRIPIPKAVDNGTALPKTGEV
jgi:ATP-dependent RNA helicase RhlE